MLLRSSNSSSHFPQRNLCLPKGLQRATYSDHRIRGREFGFYTSNFTNSGPVFSNYIGASTEIPLNECDTAKAWASETRFRDHRWADHGFWYPILASKRQILEDGTEPNRIPLLLRGKLEPGLSLKLLCALHSIIIQEAWSLRLIQSNKVYYRGNCLPRNINVATCTDENENDIQLKTKTVLVVTGKQ